MIHALSSRTLAIILGVIAGLGCVYILVSYLSAPTPTVVYYTQRVQLLLNPSAERAFTYGMTHFNGSFDAEAYNLDRALYFLDAAVKLDPAYPNANQQLARVHFLRGNFKIALSHINAEINLHESPDPSAYYIRGLIYGFDGLYERAAEDFERFVALRPEIWAGYNDLAWTLMKSGDSEKALAVLVGALETFPDNAWLLNSYAVALYETGDTAAAQAAAERAIAAVAKVTPADWSAVNPGNDPRSAGQGLETFKQATASNLNKIIAETNAGASVDGL